MQHRARVAFDHGRHLSDLLPVGIPPGHQPAVLVVIEGGSVERDTQCAGPQRFVEQPLHGQEVVVGGRAAEGPLPHDRVPHQRVTDK